MNGIKNHTKLKGLLTFIAIVFVISALAFVKFYSEYLEVLEVGKNFVSIYIKNLNTKIAAYFITTLLVFIVCYIQLIIARVCLINAGVKQPILENNLILFLICAGIGLISGLFLSDELSSAFLLFTHSIPFNLNDPIFYKDISYYVFSRPFLLIITECVTTYWILMMIITGVVYFISYIKPGERTLVDLAECKPIINHITVNIVIFMLIKAVTVTITAQDMLVDNFSNYTGVGFVGEYVWLNYYRICPYLMLVITGLVIYFVRKRNIKFAAVSFASYFIIYLIAFVTAFVVDAVYVSPNESKVEEKYIKYNIDYTRKAYNIDDVVETEYKINNSYTKDDIVKIEPIAENIRTVDLNATLTATNQLQSLRSYYKFKDLDIAVYNIKGDNKTVILGARELDNANNTEILSSYINKKYKYTHGYGVVMTSINSVTSQGEPDYLIKDINQAKNDGIPYIAQPRIYFGETDSENVIVNSRIREIDYSEGNVDYEFDYDGNAGIGLNFLNRLVFAIKTGDLKMLVSNQITDNSRLLLNRNILDRVSLIAPFLKIDNDPHVVITDSGKLIWVVDAYTTSNQFPYAQSYDGINYVRNSVKVTVDAYDGTVKFYIIDDTDPIVMAYNNTYPDLFEKKELPDEIFKKSRYPEWLFKAQCEMYSKYHTKSPSTFYNKSDMYSIASEKYNNEIKQMEPYYNMMQLDEFNNKEPELIFMLPYTLYNRENMVAWIAAGNTKENYGKIVCYKYPKNYNIYGPLQIENMIDNDAEISKELTLWNSGGSTVIRGNLLVIPAMGGILYIEPVYINSENQASIPALKKMIAVFGDNVVMADDLKTALTKVFSKDIAGIYQTNSEISTDLPDTEINEIKKQITDIYITLEQSVKDGDWILFGETMQEMKGIVDEFKVYDLTPDTTIEENNNFEEKDLTNESN